MRLPLYDYEKNDRDDLHCDLNILLECVLGSKLSFSHLTHLSLVGLRKEIAQKFRKACPESVFFHYEPPPESDGSNRLAGTTNSQFYGSTYHGDTSTVSTNAQTLGASQTFYSLNGDSAELPVNYYRHAIYDHIQYNVGEAPYELARVAPQLKNISVDFCDDDTWYRRGEFSQTEYLYAKTSLFIGAEPVALPSWSSDETIVLMHISGCAASDIIIQYCDNENLYYINLRNQNHKGLLWITIDYLLKIPSQACTIRSVGELDAIQLDADLKGEISYIMSGFQSRALSTSASENSDGQAVLDAMYSEKVGVCRHRVAVLLHKIQNFPSRNPVRVIMNDVHAFIEVKIGNTWRKICLGGGEGRIELDKRLGPPKDPVPNHAARSQAEATSGCAPANGTDPKEGQENASVFATSTDSLGITHKDQSKEKGSKRNTASNPNHQDQKDGTMIQAIDPKFEFLNTLLTQPLKKQYLLQAKSDQAGINLVLQLEAHAKEHGIDLFYIGSPNDLHCHGSFITEEGIQTGAGGPLYEFLNQSGSKALLIDWARFNQSDLVRCLGLIAERRIDGIEIPERIAIIGVTDPATFLAEELLQYSKPMVLVDGLNERPKSSEWRQPSTQSAEVIELADNRHWESRLLGQWQIKGDNFKFCPGRLVQCLNEGISHVQICHGPKDDPVYDLFWSRLAIRRQFEFAGKTYHVPEEFGVSFNDDPNYDWQPLCESLSLLKVPVDEPLPRIVINPNELHTLYSVYACQDNKLHHMPGLIEQHANQSVIFDVTRAIRAGEWFELLSAARNHNLKIKVVGPNGMLPTELITALDTALSEPEETDHLTESKVIFTTAETDLSSVDVEIDISDYGVADLFPTISLDKTGEGQGFRFSQRDTDIYRLLAEGKTVLFKGVFSKSLEDRLKVYAINPPDWLTGQIICREEVIPLSLPEESSKVIEPFALHDLSESTAKRFTKDRQKAVAKVLADAPFVYLSGLTGTGKSTFVLKELRGENDSLFVGMHKCLDWVTDQASTGTRYLFIDEANITNRGWSEFEGLFAEKPFILINGAIHYLSPQHKVIFAGNPIAYGGERTVPRFLAHRLSENPNRQIIFGPLSAAKLYQEVLARLGIEAEKARQILSVYEKVLSYSTTITLLTPRELELMALEMRADTGEDGLAIIYDIAITVIPTSFQDDFKRWFVEQFKPIHALHPAGVESKKGSAFASRQIARMLAVRAMRQSADMPPGLGGIVLEGDAQSDEEKTRLIRTALEDAQLTQGEDEDYVLITADMLPSRKHEILEKAFHAGQIVWFQHINSCSANEALMNALLMGVDLNGKPPKTPGFMLIGTQRPMTLEGYRSTSQALNRRLLTVKIPNDYTEVLKPQVQATPKRASQSGEGSKTNLDSAKEILEKYRSHLQDQKALRAPTFFGYEHRSREKKLERVSDIIKNLNTSSENSLELVISNMKEAGLDQHSLFGHWFKCRTDGAQVLRQIERLKNDEPLLNDNKRIERYNLN